MGLNTYKEHNRSGLAGRQFVRAALAASRNTRQSWTIASGRTRPVAGSAQLTIERCVPRIIGKQQVGVLAAAGIEKGKKCPPALASERCAA